MGAWPLTKRRLLNTALYLGLGGLLGYASLAAGPIAIGLGIVVLALLGVRARSQAQNLGYYLLGLGLVGTLIGLHVVIGSRPCDNPEVFHATGALTGGGVPSGSSCYSPSTLPGLAIYAGAAVVGALVLWWANQRRASSRSEGREA
jgi:hypothetical protein